MEMVEAHDVPAGPGPDGRGERVSDEQHGA